MATAVAAELGIRQSAGCIIIAGMPIGYDDFNSECLPYPGQKDKSLPSHSREAPAPGSNRCPPPGGPTPEMICATPLDPFLGSQTPHQMDFRQSPSNSVSRFVWAVSPWITFTQTYARPRHVTSSSSSAAAFIGTYPNLHPFASPASPLSIVWNDFCIVLPDISPTEAAVFSQHHVRLCLNAAPHLQRAVPRPSRPAPVRLEAHRTEARPFPQSYLRAW